MILWYLRLCLEDTVSLYNTFQKKHTVIIIILFKNFRDHKYIWDNLGDKSENKSFPTIVSSRPLGYSKTLVSRSFNWSAPKIFPSLEKTPEWVFFDQCSCTMEQEQAMWTSPESNSMVSATIGRAMSTLLSARPKKLEDAVSRLNSAPQRSSVGAFL